MAQARGAATALSILLFRSLDYSDRLLAVELTVHSVLISRITNTGPIVGRFPGVR
jgi:hypothetical protein